MLKDLLERLPQTGTLEWIGVRPIRRTPPTTVEEVMLDPVRGLIGDHYSGRSGKRHVTLLQAEHVPAILSLLHLDWHRPTEVYPLLRRNLVVSHLNLLALMNQRFTIGGVLLEATGHCHPCSRMEEAFGPGGYNAIRGHGGITARVLTPGVIRLGDPVAMVAPDFMPGKTEGA